MADWLAPLAATTLLASACAAQPEKKTMITETQAVELAKAAFTKAGHQVSDYDVSAERDDAVEDRWLVWFELKGPFRIPGGRHHVRVDGKTGQAVFMAGQ